MKRFFIVITTAAVLLLLAMGTAAQTPNDPRGTPKGPRRVIPLAPRAGVPRDVPANDNFIDAIAVSGLPTPYTNTVADFVEATGETDEPDDCFSATKSVWYSLTPASDLVVTLDTEGSTFDTVLAVYTGAAVDALTTLACNDDFSVTVDAGFSSTITGLSLTGGTPYMIRVSAFDDGALLAGDTATLNVKPTPEAGTFTVDSLSDAVDMAIGDGTCAAAGGACTLRAAVNEANASQSGSVITLPAGVYVLSIDAPVNPSQPGSKLYENAAINGDLDIVTGVTISGVGPQTTVVDGGDIDTVFEFFAGANVTISGITVRNGSRPGTQSAGGGVRLNETAIVALHNVWITGNSAVFGGGVTVEGGTLTMIDSAITGNVATGRTFDNDPDPDTYLAGNGGGIEVRSGVAFDVAISLSNVTISGNAAVAPDATVASWGGAVYFGAPFANLDATFKNVTIAGNSASKGGGVYTDAVLAQANVDVVFDNTLIADNSALTQPDCHGNIGSTGSNLIENTSGCTIDNDDLTGDPFLAVLTLNAPGQTPTHLTAAASPARDSGNPATCSLVDQRGISRPQASKCDIGALEAIATAPGLFNVITPLPNTVIPSATGLTELTWQPSPNAYSYTLVIDNVTTSTPVNVFTTTVAAASACDVTTCTATIATSFSDGLYRFGAVAHADTLAMPASGTNGFQIDSLAGLPNLLANASFETSAGKGQPTKWKPSAITGDKRECNKDDKTVALDGSCAYRFKGTKREKTSLKQKLNLKTIAIAQGDAFRVTFYASTGDVDATAVIKIKYTKKSIPATKLKITLPDSGKLYTPYIGEVIASDRRVGSVSVKFNNKSKSGKWYVDAVRGIHIAAGARQTRSDGGLLPSPPAPDGFRGQN